jgi:hypothetical protein
MSAPAPVNAGDMIGEVGTTNVPNMIAERVQLQRPGVLIVLVPHGGTPEGERGSVDVREAEADQIQRLIH